MPVFGDDFMKARRFGDQERMAVVIVLHGNLLQLFERDASFYVRQARKKARREAGPEEQEPRVEEREVPGAPARTAQRVPLPLPAPAPVPVPPDALLLAPVPPVLLCVPYAPLDPPAPAAPPAPAPEVPPVALAPLMPVLLSVELLAPVLPLPAMPLVPPVPLDSPVVRGPDDAPLELGLPAAVELGLLELLVPEVVVLSLRPHAVTEKASATLNAINEVLIMWCFLWVV
jgi:hypothetical protein